MEYPLCDQTVTVYHMVGGQVFRQVIHGCYFQRQDRRKVAMDGPRFSTRFLLVIPGDTLQVFPGDRVFPGEGPEVVDWDTFLPATEPQLAQIGWVKPCYWKGTLCHTEAGDQEGTWKF